MIAYLNTNMQKSLIMNVYDGKIWQLSGEQNFTFFSMLEHVDRLYPKYLSKKIVLSLNNYLQLTKLHLPQDEIKPKTLEYDSEEVSGEKLDELDC